MAEESTVTVERDEHVLLMGLNRPQKRNAFNMDMLRELSLAYGELDRDPELRCGVVHGYVLQVVAVSGELQALDADGRVLQSEKIDVAAAP